MAKKNTYAVHEDFKMFPVFNFRFNKLFIGFINVFFSLERFITQRKKLQQATKHFVTAEDGHAIPVYQFNPTRETNKKKLLPAVIYYHGGGFVMTYASSHIHITDHYAQEANCRSFLVDYRLALTDPYPTGFNDCYAVFQWIKDNADKLGVDPGRIVVAGDSAGGGLAASVAQKDLTEAGENKNKEKNICGQILVYPTLDHTCQTKTAKDYVDTPMWNSVSNRSMWDVYLKNVPADRIPEYASPATRQDLSNLPAAYVETAEFDPLKDEGEDYAKRLIAANVPVTLHQPLGTVHGYDAIFSSDISLGSVEKRITFLKELFS